MPFSPETSLSGVNRQLKPDEYLWYERKLEIDRIPAGKRLSRVLGQHSLRLLLRDALPPRREELMMRFAALVQDLIQLKCIEACM